jgi:hypothetical protein
MVAGIGRWVDYARGDSLKKSLKCEVGSLQNVIASEAKQSPTPGIELASSLRSSQ